MTTGQRIKSARKKVGLTQKELGERMGQSFQSIAQWENDLRNPKLETLQRIASALGVPLQDLVDDWGAVDKEELKQVIIYGKGTTGGTSPQEQISAPQMPTDLCDNMRYCREILGLTQKALAEKTGIPLKTIRAYEDGSSGHFITEEDLQKVVSVLGIPRQVLLGHSVTHEWLQLTSQENRYRQVNEAMQRLNSIGQQEAVKRVEELTYIPEYRAKQAPESTLPAREGTDTTPAEKLPQRPQEGTE